MVEHKGSISVGHCYYSKYTSDLSFHGSLQLYLFIILIDFRKGERRESGEKKETESKRERKILM